MSSRPASSALPATQMSTPSIRVLTNSSVLSTLILLSSLHCTSAAATDLFLGKFASETRENFGSDNPGEYTLDVTAKGKNYVIAMSHNGVSKGSVEATPCNAADEGYLSDRPAGEARVLCRAGEVTPTPLLSYSENGIKITVTGKSYKTKYYARIGWAIRGFRKIR